MKRKLIAIVLIFLGVIMAAGAWLTYSEAPKAQEELKSAVFLEKPVVLQENEGKLVVCSGTMEMTAPARDKDLGLSFPSPRVRRRTEQRKVDGDKKEWVIVHVDGSDSDNLYGQAKIGEFDLSPKLLRVLSTPKNCTEFDGEELERAGLMARNRLAERTYLYVLDSDPPSKFQRGMRCSYDMYDLKKAGTVTVVGFQKGRALYPSKHFSFMKGALNREEFLKKQKRMSLLGNLMLGMIGISLLLGGILTIRKS